MAILKRDRGGVVAKFLQRVHNLPDDKRKELKAAAKLADATGDQRPIIDFLKALVSDPATLQALLKLLPILLPLLLALL